jgi:hypothetical protein
MKFLIIAIITVALAACSSDPRGFIPTESAILGPIYALKGKKVDDAVAYLGLPDEDTILIGRRVVIWRESTTVAGTYVNSSGPTATAYSTANNFHCDIKLVIGNDSVVESVEIEKYSAYYCPRGPSK